MLPGRLGASYVAPDGSAQVPVLLHHAILGSMERFIGILLGGPRRTAAGPAGARAGGGRVDCVSSDIRSERIARKVADAARLRIPWIAVVGDREEAEGAVSLSRPSQRGKRLVPSEAIARIEREAAV